ncbi:MAG TPA: O-antigen ligase family protein [Bacteroidales bacterium]|nr:O-antigen ligase family protein [Bacteroidales bacterium]
MKASISVSDKLKIKWVYGICAIFIVLNSIFIVKEFYWFTLIPVLLIIALLFIFALDKLLLFIVFLTPLSINLSDFDYKIGLSLPTEPLMFATMLVFLIKMLFERKFDSNIIKHPVTIFILIYLFWIFFTSLTSTMPIVSFKYLVSKMWFIIPFYFVASQLFKEKNNIRNFIWCYMISLILVVFYTVIHHSLYGFDEVTAHWVMTPFFNDHTSYGALLAMFIPFSFAFIFDKNLIAWKRIVSLIFFLIFIIALILSYSRAAWLSLAVGLVVFLIMVLKINYKYVISGVIMVIGLYFVYKSDVVMYLEKNKQTSSKDYIEHIQSISNISNDASNLERINRWQSAIRMFKEKPILGWGPGTYQFKYAPYQLSKEKTIISTNSGDMGNAHSEYIGPLAEMGLLGLLSVISIILVVTYTAVKVYKRSRDREVKFFIIVSIISLSTYFVHGFLNNFLDTDKASVPFWGFIALIVILDVTSAKKEKEFVLEDKLNNKQ